MNDIGLVDLKCRCYDEDASSALLKDLRQEVPLVARTCSNPLVAGFVRDDGCNPYGNSHFHIAPGQVLNVRLVVVSNVPWNMRLHTLAAGTRTVAVGE